MLTFSDQRKVKCSQQNTQLMERVGQKQTTKSHKAGQLMAMAPWLEGDASDIRQLNPQRKYSHVNLQGGQFNVVNARAAAAAAAAPRCARRQWCISRPCSRKGSPHSGTPKRGNPLKAALIVLGCVPHSKRSCAALQLRWQQQSVHLQERKWWQMRPSVS